MELEGSTAAAVVVGISDYNSESHIATGRRRHFG
jgi:hypothetical protein